MNIEFIHTTEFANIRDHCRRGYQGKHKLLVIVLTGTEKSGKYFRDQLYRNRDEIPMLEHVLILNKKEFQEFIAFSNPYYENFVEATELYSLAAFGTHKKYFKNELEKLSKLNEYELENVLPARYGEDLKEFGWQNYLKTHDLLDLLRDNALPKDEPQQKIDNYLGDR